MYIYLCISLCIYLYIFIMLKLSIFDLFLLYTHCIISLALFALFTFDLSSFSLCFCLYLSLYLYLFLSHFFCLYLQQTNYPASDLIMNWSQFVLNSFQYQPQFLNGAQRPSPIRKAAKPISSLDPPPLPLSTSLPPSCHTPATTLSRM